MNETMTNSQHDDRHPPPPGGSPLGRTPLGHRLMFIVLAMLAFALFAPVVVLPLLREHGAVLAEEAGIAQRCEALREEIDQRSRLVEAFAADAAVNEKLAMLDLQYRRPGEEILPVLPRVYEPAPAPRYTPPAARSALLIPDDWPAWAIRAEVWAQQQQLIDLFLDDDLRPIFLLMSAGLLIAAFALFAPRVAEPADRPARPFGPPISPSSLSAAR